MQIRRLPPAIAVLLAVGAAIALVVLWPRGGACHIAYEVRRVTAPIDKRLSQHLLTTDYGSARVGAGVLGATHGEKYTLSPNLSFRVSKVGEKFCRIAFEQPVTDVRFTSIAGKLPAVHYKEVQEISLAEKLPDTHLMSEAKARAKQGVQIAYLLKQDSDALLVYILSLPHPNTP